MEKLKEFIEKNKLILAVSLFCLSTRLFLYHPAPPGWDEATYIQIGRYLFSAGQIGFLEPFRPLLWPTILGLIWKFNLNPVVFGHILMLLFSLGNVILVYLIGKRVYGLEAGVLAALLLAISPSFFFWGDSILTEIPASFLGLLSIYLVLKEGYFFSGFFSMLAFAMKFVQFFTLIPIAGVILYRSLSQRSLVLKSPLVQYFLGCIPAVMVLASAHFILYRDIFLPFADARLVYTQIPYGWMEGIQYALTVLLKMEGGLLIFVPLAILVSRRFLTEERMIILAVAVLQFLWVAKLPTDLSRFLLSLLPYLYLLTAEGMSRGYLLVRKNGGGFLLAVFFSLLLGIQCYRIMTIRFPSARANILHEYLNGHQGNITGAVWISNPAVTLDSRLKITERMYYPVFDLKKIAVLRSKLHEADFIFVDSKDLRCPAQGFTVCEIERDKLFETIRRDFHAELYFKEPSGNRILGVFRKRKGAG